MQNGFNPESKRSRQLTCVVSPEVPQRGAAAPSVEIKSPSADSTGVLVPVTGDSRTAGSSSLHADSQDPIQGATCKGQRRVPKYQGQGLNPVWSAKGQKRGKEQSPPNDKILLCFQSHEKQHWTTLSICDIILTWVRHLKSQLRFLYQRGWDRNIPGTENFPRNISELKWSSNTLHLQY